MGYPECPSWKERRTLRSYKCRRCGRKFKDYYLPEEKRVCPRCYEKPVECGDWMMKRQKLLF
jgi:DNA-directed RNA polymerase subunit RPC12/RpoP